MAEFKVTINDPKTGKSYNKVLETNVFKGKKLHSKVSGDSIGLKGYELEITGGSDTSGFPMRADIQGSTKKRPMLTGGIGVTIPRKGARIRKTVRGNEISLETAQVNLKIIKYGAKKVEDLFGAPKEKAKKGEAPKEAKSDEKPKEEKKEEVKEEKPKEEKKEEAPKEEKKEEAKKEEK